jgi:hypothetical protein
MPEKLRLFGQRKMALRPYVARVLGVSGAKLYLSLTEVGANDYRDSYYSVFTRKIGVSSVFNAEPFRT